MFTILVCHDKGCARASIHVVDEDGALAHSTPAVERALRWLWQKGERQVVAITDAGPELFLIEECQGLTMTLPSFSMRRAFHGTCADLPEFLGIGGDPCLRARVLAEGKHKKAAARQRRERWVDRATCPAAND